MFEVRSSLEKMCLIYRNISFQNIKHFRYEAASTIYAIGGAMSLFLGVSISMVFEIVEFLIDLVLNLALHYVYRKKNRLGPKMEKGC